MRCYGTYKTEIHHESQTHNKNEHVQLVSDAPLDYVLVLACEPCLSSGQLDEGPC